MTAECLRPMANTPPASSLEHKYSSNEQEKASVLCARWMDAGGYFTALCWRWGAVSVWAPREGAFCWVLQDQKALTGPNYIIQLIIYKAVVMDSYLVWVKVSAESSGKGIQSTIKGFYQSVAHILRDERILKCRDVWFKAVSTSIQMADVHICDTKKV